MFKEKKKKKNMDKLGKIFSALIWGGSGMLVKYFIHSMFWHALCCKIIRSQIDLKLKTRTEFPNVCGEYKNHNNPYIHSTTVLCDNYPALIKRYAKSCHYAARHTQ